MFNFPFPLPIHPTNSPYHDFIVSVSFLVFIMHAHKSIYDNPAFYDSDRYIFKATHDLQDMHEGGQLYIGLLSFFGIINIADMFVKGIRLVISIVYDTNYIINLLQEEWVLGLDRLRRGEIEKNRSVRSFLKYIQDRIELVKQEEIFLEEIREEKLKVIKKQKIIKKQMKEYCFPNDDDLD